MKALPIQFDESIPAWEKAIYAFLAEKERRSGSMRTVDAYTRTLQRFFGTLGKTPEQITPPDVFGFAHGIGPSGREPAAITIGARLACISSFYRFLIRMEIVTRNPCDQLERPKVSPSPPRGLSADDIRRLLAAIPETPSGLLSSVGLQGPGLDGFLQRDLPWLLSRGARAVVSIAGGSVDEFAELAARLSDAAGITAIEVNISPLKSQCFPGSEAIQRADAE